MGFCVCIVYVCDVERISTLSYVILQPLINFYLIIKSSFMGSLIKHMYI